MEPIRTRLEKEAFERIAAELPVELLFLRQAPGNLRWLLAGSKLKSLDDVCLALQRLYDTRIAALPNEHLAVKEMVRHGIFKHDGGCFVLVAGESVRPVAEGNVYEWAKKVAAAWSEMIDARVVELTKPKITPSQVYLAKRFELDEVNLWMLAEEAGEVVRGCGKLGRWGYDHVHPATGESGMKLLEAEIGDFMATVEIMIARGHFDPAGIEAAKAAKFERLEKWYEAPWTPADSATIEVEKASQRRAEEDQQLALRQARAERLKRALIPSRIGTAIPSQDDRPGLANAYTPITAPEFIEKVQGTLGSQPLPLTAEGDLNWNFFDNCTCLLTQGVGGLVTVVATDRDGCTTSYQGKLANPLNI